MGYSWVWSLCCPDLKIPPSFTNSFAAGCGETPQEAVPRMPFAENSPSSPFLFSPFFLLLKSVVIFVCLPLFLLPLFPLFFGFFFFNFKHSSQSQSAEGASRVAVVSTPCGIVGESLQGHLSWSSLLCADCGSRSVLLRALPPSHGH